METASAVIIWRDMSSAPKDGREIMLFNSRARRLEFARWGAIRHFVWRSFRFECHEGWCGQYTVKGQEINDADMWAA